MDYFAVLYCCFLTFGSLLMPQAYSFHDFVLKPEELSLYHKNQRLELGLKGFKLLVALVENQGKLVPKDELIAAAWGEQIVTDGTLSKQMERIRQVLGEYCPDITFVETVRGIGYKFIPEVKVHIDRKKGLVKWQKAIATVSIIPFILFLYFYPFNQESTEATEKHIMPFNIAVIPAARGEDYMNVGGIEYLSTLLGKNPRIYHTSPRSSWFKSEDKHKLAIELEDQKNLDYVLLVNIKEEGENKIASLELKNNSQFKQSRIFNALSFKQLFSDINSWVLIQLKIENSPQIQASGTESTNDLSSDSFAVESFLRGIEASSARDYKTAIQYLKTAIAQDNDFDLAKLELVYAQIKSNDYTAAEALLGTLESTQHLKDDLRLYLLTLKAALLTSTLRSSEVKPFIAEAIGLAEKTQNPRKKILALYYQGEMYSEMGEIELSIESTLKQKEVLELNSKNQTDLMRVANNLAHTYYRIKQYEKAKSHIIPAIEWFEKTNHMVGMINSYGLLANIHKDLAQYLEATSVINKALSLKSKVQDQHLILNILETSGYLQLELGKHDDCRKTIKEIEALATVMKTGYTKYIVMLMKAELNQRTNNPSQLKEDSIILDEITQSLEQDNPYIREVVLNSVIQSNLILENYAIVKTKLEEFRSLIKDDQTESLTFYHINKNLYELKTNSSKNAVTKLREILIEMVKTKQNRIALIVADILLEYDQNQTFENSFALLNQIEHIKPPPYPYLKYKAKLAAHEGNYFEASTLMQEMKNTSNQWWDTDDQILLDSYFDQIKQ